MASQTNGNHVVVNGEAYVKASQTKGNNVVVNGGTGGDLSYHEKINSDPARLKFAYA